MVAPFSRRHKKSKYYIDMFLVLSLMVAPYSRHPKKKLIHWYVLCLLLMVATYSRRHKKFNNYIDMFFVFPWWWYPIEDVTTNLTITSKFYLFLPWWWHPLADVATNLTITLLCSLVFPWWWHPIVGCIFSRLFFLIELKIFLVADINERLSFPKFRENWSMSWIATLPSKFCKCHIKSKFQNYGRMVVDSLKRSS